MATTPDMQLQQSEELDHVLRQLAQATGAAPDTPEYALLAAKAALQYHWGGQVIAFRLVSGWEGDNFRAKYVVVDDEGGTLNDVYDRLAARSDVHRDDVQIDYIEPLDAEPTMPEHFDDA